MSDESIDSCTKSNQESRSLSNEQVVKASRDAAHGIVWILSSTVVWQVVSWVLTLWAARVLTPADYGLVALADTVTPYLVILASLRLDYWTLQITRWSERDQEAIQTFSIVFALFLFVLALLGAPLLSKFYNRPDVELPFQILCSVLLIRSLRIVPESRLRRELQFKQIAIANFVVGILRGILQLALAIFGWRYWSLVTASVLAELFQMIWIAYIAGMPRRLSWNRGLVVDAVRYGVPTSMSHICWIVFSTADSLAVGRFLGTVALGFYSMAFYLTELPLSKLNTVISPVIGPYYARLRFNPTDLATTVLRVNRLTAFLIAPVLFGLFAISRPFIALVFGDQWLPLTEPFRIMCFISAIRALAGNNSLLLMSIGKARECFLLALVPAIVMPIAFFLGVSRWGFAGLFASWFAVYPIVGPLFGWWIVSRHLDLSILQQLRNIVPPIFFGAAIAAAVLSIELTVLVNSELWIQLAGGILIGVLVAGLIVRLVFWEELWSSFAVLKQLRQGNEVETSSTLPDGAS